MDFAIPTDLPVQDTDIVVDHEKAKSDAAANEQAQAAGGQSSITPEAAESFLKANDLIPLLNELLGDVIVAAPEDPIDHMTRWFLRHSPATEAERAESGPEEEEAAVAASKERNDAVSRTHDSAVAYCGRFCLPQLIDELLSAMIVESPSDQGRFAMSWLRWHKKKFILRHKPAGYAAFIARENQDVDRTPASAEETSAATPAEEPVSKPADAEASEEKAKAKEDEPPASSSPPPAAAAEATTTTTENAAPVDEAPAAQASEKSTPADSESKAEAPAAADDKDGSGAAEAEKKE